MVKVLLLDPAPQWCLHFVPLGSLFHFGKNREHTERPLYYRRHNHICALVRRANTNPTRFQAILSNPDQYTWFLWTDLDVNLLLSRDGKLKPESRHPAFRPNMRPLPRHHLVEHPAYSLHGCNSIAKQLVSRHQAIHGNHLALDYVFHLLQQCTRAVNRLQQWGRRSWWVDHPVLKHVRLVYVCSWAQVHSRFGGQCQDYLVRPLRLLYKPYQSQAAHLNHRRDVH